MVTRKNWVAGLRSGKYQQGKFRLRNKDKYCCLGVACDINDSSQWEKMPNSPVYLYEGCTDILPDELRNLLNLALSEATILTSMNDSGADFNEIADYIEGLS